MLDKEDRWAAGFGFFHRSKNASLSESRSITNNVEAFYLYELVLSPSRAGALTETMLNPNSSAMDLTKLVFPDPLAPFISTEICNALVKVTLAKQDDRRSRSLVEAAVLNAFGVESFCQPV